MSVSGSAIPSPNGVVWANDAIWVALDAGRLQSYDLSGAMQQDIALRSDQVPAGALDGLVHLGEGRFLVSSWEASAVFEIDLSDAASPGVSATAEELPGPADIDWDSGRNRLLVPLFMDNELALIDLK